MEAPTKKQKVLLDFIEEYQFAYGKSPTFKEMREHFNVSSDNSILKHINGLKKKGYLLSDPTPRGIKMLSRVREALDTGMETVKLPLVGMVPAGGPALSSEHVVDYVNLDKQFVKYPDKSFMLKVTGESMSGAGIYEGDLVVATQKKDAKVGDIVVALVDGENTIKRLVKGKDGKLYLKAENPEYNDVYALAELKVQGVVVALIRAY